jgi:DNA-binding NtrC family response regulator
MKRIAGTEKILIVDSDTDYFSRLSKVLMRQNNRLEILYSANEKHTLMQLEKKPDIKLVLIDDSMEHHEFENVLNHVKKRPAMQILIVSEQAGNNTSEYGQEFVNKLDIDKIKDCIVARVDDYDKIKKDYGISKTSPRQDIENLMGKGKVISEVLDSVEKYANINKPFLIEGETGTGKELIAEYWYRLSGLKKFVIVNCATLSNELAVSELFGSVKGAFTGAENKEGMVKTADGGMLFFDEFNSLPLDIQIKFLRLIEYNTYYKIGDNVEQKADVRVIAAGNKSFKELVKKGEFRLDLYERFIDTVRIPTLKERIEDIDFFIDSFISEENKVLGKTASISDEAKLLLIRHDWIGNVRELKNFIEKLVVMVNPDEYSNKYIIKPQLVQDFFDKEQEYTNEILMDDVPKEDEDYSLRTACELAYNEAAEKAIKRALAKIRGDNEKAIELLKISRGTYFNLKKKFGI